MIGRLKAGRIHPDEIAKDLKITRQAVNNHLDTLCRLGIIERAASAPGKERPKIVYSLTSHGLQLLQDMDAALAHYQDLIDNAYQRAEASLDDLLLRGLITEEIYRDRLNKLNAARNDASG